MALTDHWALDDDAASTTVVADVGGNTGTLQGGDNTADKSVAGPGGSVVSGLHLNDVDDYISITQEEVANNAAFSLSLWFNSDSFAALQPFVARAGSAFRGLWATNSTTIVVSASNGSVSFTVTTMSTGAWHHLLVTRTSGESTRVFLDGTESSTGAQTLDGLWTIDAFGRRSTDFFDGVLAWIKFFDSDESANVATLYAEGVSEPPAGTIDPFSQSLPGVAVDPLRTSLP